MKTTRLAPGLYKVEKEGRVYIVENVGPETDRPHRPQWNISEQVVRDGNLYRTEAFDAADTLRGAQFLIAGFASDPGVARLIERVGLNS
jgi:hypothetical protein